MFDTIDVQDVGRRDRESEQQGNKSGRYYKGREGEDITMLSLLLKGAFRVLNPCHARL